jgi:hypothetical protein
LEEMAHQSSFSVSTPRDFFELIVMPQYEDFVKSNASPRHALLSVITAYHMIEWVCKEHERQKFIYAMPTVAATSHELARKITNGTKHFRSRIKTRRQAGFSSDFSFAFARPFMVEKDDGSEISVDELLANLVGFWKAQQPKGLF